MRIRAGFEITYDCPAPTPMQLLLNVHFSRQPDLETPDLLRAWPEVPVEQFMDGFGNTCSRVVAPQGLITFSNDFVIRDSGAPDPTITLAQLTPVETLPADVTEYLLGSRYCETDRMSELAWSLFGQLPADWSRVQAIVDYAHQRIAFGYEHARPTKTAWEAHEERRGVCRDYAHLAITLCRCMNIPARYCTGYLGDIGVPVSDAPMDFSAWFEAYVGGAWWIFDARHNTPRIGRILIARGRDAADAAITTAFGQVGLAKFTVITEEIPEATAAAPAQVPQARAAVAC